METKITRKEYMNNYMKKYRSEHPECYKKKITCECGANYTYSCKTSHLKGEIHRTNMIKIKMEELQEQLIDMGRMF